MKDAQIPKIDPLSPDKNIPVSTPSGEPAMEKASTGDSILIPKIGEPVIQKQEPEPKTEPTQIQKPKSPPTKYKKILIGIGIFLGVLIVAFVVPALLLLQSGKSLVASSNKLAEAGKAGNFPAMKSEMVN